MRTVLLTATALAAFSSLASGQNQLPATTSSKPNAVVDPTMPKVRANAPGDGRLHYDMPCRVSSVGTCVTPEPPPSAKTVTQNIWALPITSFVSVDVFGSKVRATPNTYKKTLDYIQSSCEEVALR